ncbi:MAG: hypothetical protein ACOYEW_07025 [Anaerolineae bacterium]|jgi:hypothetical protein
MAKRTWLAGLLIVALVVVAAGAPLLRNTSQAGMLGPAETVEAFYAWYLDYIGDPATGEFRNPLADRAYRDSAYLAPEFIAEVDALLDSFEGGGYDPFLMAQDVPTEIHVGEAMVAGDMATVPVTTSFPGHSLEVTLAKGTDGVWQITDITR